MDYNYLRLRLQTFRREYFDISSKWFKSSWSWLWHFTIENFKYLYLGEIHQIKYLSNTVKQQKNYIDLIQSDSTNSINKLDGRLPYDTTVFENFLKVFFLICLLPLSFIIYWVRRIIRIILGRKFQLVISSIKPTEDMELDTNFQGMSSSVYLIPKTTRTFPRGLVIFKYSISVTDSVIEPYLYIDPGVGFTSNYMIPLPYFKDREEQELLLELPPHCELLQLELASKEINIKLKNISIMESNFFHAAWYLKTKHGYGINEILHALFIKKLPGVRRTRADKSSYPDWYLAYARLASDDKIAIYNHIETFINPPLFSIVINIDNEHPELLDQCFKSLLAQLYPNWELLVTCQLAPDTHVTSILNKYQSYDQRVRISINENTAQITCKIGEALKHAKGEFIIFLEYKDILTDHGLYIIACHILKNNDAKLIYSDYDHINQYGALFEPCFKPDWNYDFFLGKNYLQYLTCYQTDLLMKVINNDVVDPFKQAYRLNLLILEKLVTLDISHIPYILLHHRKLDAEFDVAKVYEQQHDIDTLKTHLQRTKQPATVTPVNTEYWIKRTVPEPQPLVSLIVLTRDRVALLSNCIHGLLEKTSYKNIEIIIVDNGSVEESTLSFLEAISKDNRVNVLRHDSEFNFSELNNIGVKYTHGEYIGLINNDISVIDPHWLDEMMSHIIRDDVGIVGAKLLYENDTIQHAGVIIGLGGVAGHNFRHEPGHARGYDDRLVLCQELSCVTAACLVTKKTVYQKVGGLDDINLRIAFNDVDFCLKVRELGLKVIWTPFAELYHLESASRGSDLSKENIHRWNAEYTFMRGKWKHVLETDPFYNPNLAITDEDFSLAHPPRLIHPWERYKYILANDNISRQKTV
jgi:GT2 family glycosyltransferase